ncbi:hypothetical protein HII31_11135 [Pseudocercospora fuligena]|uniref:Uncharacterized protein n=1 Tax=Pseudocercospora fuligena TaxID=685502 RepID=A0A8H6RAG2_9PEZI|nr:hypothetical protein HII31_11135 [Pseudocercospora fuligena]
MASAPPSAGARVAGTFELLEQILLDTFDDEPEADEYAECTGLRTVLLSQRTCRAFQETIANSTSLQKELYFLEPEAGSSGVANPLLWRGVQLSDGFTLDPLIPLTAGIADHVVLYRIPGWHRRNIVKQEDEAEMESWRRMYLYKVPYEVKRVEFRSGWDREITGRAQNPTLGHLWDAVAKHGKALSWNGKGDIKTMFGQIVGDWGYELETVPQRRLPRKA